jgi:hypothetical protein
VTASAGSADTGLPLGGAITVGLFTLAVFALALWAPGLLNDGDSWWHVEAGRLMISRHTLLTTDPFSYTRAGAPWFTHEWLSELLMAGAFNLAGWSGVLLLTAVAAAATAGLLARHTGRMLGGTPQIILLLIALPLCSPHLLARPHVLAWPLLELWGAELIFARAEGRPPRWRMLPLMTLWANLHGSFVFGLALIGPFALEALLAAKGRDRGRVVLTWGGFGVAALLAACVGPHGVETVLFPFRLMATPGLIAVGEWAPADFSKLSPIEYALLATLLVLMLRPVALPIIRAALLVGLFHLSLQHNRHEQLLGLIGPLVLAAPLAKAFPTSGAVAPRPAGKWLMVGAAVFALCLAAPRLATPVVWRDGPTTPVHALAAVPGDLRKTPVINDYSFSGYLIGQGVRPYIDSRTELYGDGFLQAYGRLAAGDRPALTAELDRRAVRWTLLAPGSPMAQAMDADPRWRRLYADRWAVVHVRRDTAP